MSKKNHNGHSQVPVEIRCTECHKPAKMVNGQDIYPHRADLHDKNFYKCTCGAYVGTHPGTCEPLGTPAGPRTRKARSEAHAYFDALYKEVGRRKPEGGSPRKRGYRWLSEKMNIRPEDCHIGMMNINECKRVVEICDPYMKKLGIVPERRR